jgi:hypothetical protein
LISVNFDCYDTCHYTQRRISECCHAQCRLAECFRVGATFEIRTVLYRIRLLIDKLEMIDRVFISNFENRGVSKIAQRERERESVFERQRTAENKG